LSITRLLVDVMALVGEPPRDEPQARNWPAA